jgi:hypothetical protein
MVEFNVQFLHPSKDETLVPKMDKQVPGGVIEMYQRVDPSTVVARIQFTTPIGIRWETLTNGAGTGETRRVSDSGLDVPRCEQRCVQSFGRECS